jgi:aminoglycoside 6'-N-acetyltransferase
MDSGQLLFVRLVPQRQEHRMRLRAATPADLALLRAWDAKGHVEAATGPDGGLDWETQLGRRVPWRELLIAESDRRPIAALQIIDPALEETHYWGEIAPNQRAIDIWIGEEADLGRGYATTIMRLALARCFAQPSVTAVLLDPLVTNERAHRFYVRLGFERVERRMFGNDDCYVYRFDRTAWDRAR